MTENSNRQRPALPTALSRELGRLDPAYFAAVMATGVVSVACQFQGWNGIAVTLTWLNGPFFFVLLFLNLLRLFKYPQQMWNDLIDHNRGVGFFTLIAAVCVLGVQSEIVLNFHLAATGLWWLGVGLWIVLTYIIFTSFAVKEEKPTRADLLLTFEWN